MSYSDLTIKTIYGRSYNECNHPDCNQVIIAVDENTDNVVNHGEMAHIRARNKGGERWDNTYPTDQLNEPNNLILLCANHHNVIDQKGAGEHYTIELLNKWKAKHYLEKEVTLDREWVYGPSIVSFFVDDQSIAIEYWRDSSGTIRFFTPEQLVQAKAAKEVSFIFAQLGDLARRISDADPTPQNPSHQTQNDAMMRILSNDVARLKKSMFSNPDTDYENVLHRLYENLKACPDVTMEELSLVGSTEKQATTTLLVGGKLTAKRLHEAMKGPNSFSSRKDS